MSDRDGDTTDPQPDPAPACACPADSRVMCCYPDIERLLANTLLAARQLYAFTVPTSRGWRGVVARLNEWIENAWNTLRGRPCPGYVHDLDLIEGHLASAGFRLRHLDRERLWHIAVYERSTVTRLS